MASATVPPPGGPARPRVLVSGGAGFLGSHLCERLLAEGYAVIAVDNFATGRLANLRTALADRNLTLLRKDVTEQDLLAEPVLAGPLAAVVHLACPASPQDYLRQPIETLRTGSLGTLNLLEVAVRKHARFVYASTSEVYGDPEVHPQHEGYWGHVNPVGPRAVYDESKRFGEAAVTAYRHHRGLDGGIVRIFNTYGPRMRGDDGRVIPAFLGQAAANLPLTVHGTGQQTRSFCYVDDLVRGLVLMMRSPQPGPINLGNPEELTVLDLAGIILDLTGATSGIELTPAMPDDPARRRPDITAAKRLLDWAPTTTLREGVLKTLHWSRLPEAVG